MPSARNRALAAIVPCLLVACSEGAAPSASASADPTVRASAGAAADPHAGLAMPPAADPHAGLRTNPHATAGGDPHAGLGRLQPVPASFAGTIVLAGKLAAEERGVLMVSACPKGSRLPLMSYVIPISEVPAAVDGRRTVPFRLDGSNDLMGGGGLPHDSDGMELELSVRFDADGKVESSEGDVTVAVPVQADAADVEIVLGQ